MRRRTFIAALGGAAAWPVAARAQQPATQRRIAIFHPAIPTTLLTETGGGSAWRAFFGELRRLGYVEGENLIIERYSAEGHHERYADLAREIVTRNPDVIVTGTNPVVMRLQGGNQHNTGCRVHARSAEGRAGHQPQPTRRQPHRHHPRSPGSRYGGKRLEIAKRGDPFGQPRAAFLAMRGGWDGSSGQVLAGRQPAGWAFR